MYWYEAVNYIRQTISRKPFQSGNKMPRSPITIKINGAPNLIQQDLVREDVDMARSRRALVRKGNVTSIAEARQKRDAQRQEQADAQAKMRISTLDEQTRKFDKSAERAIVPPSDTTEQGTEKKTEKSARKVGNRTFNREKVEAIKKSIANGEYQINYQRVADRFIERESVG